MLIIILVVVVSVVLVRRRHRQLTPHLTPTLILRQNKLHIFLLTWSLDDLFICLYVVNFIWMQLHKVE